MARLLGARLFPPGPQGLQEGVGDLTEQGVVVQAGPGPSLVVVQAQLLLELLVRLLTGPPTFEGGGKLFQRGVGGMVGEVELALARRAVLAHQPALLAGQVLGTGGNWPVGDAHAPGCERRPQWTLGARAPGQRLERRVRRVGEQGRHRGARL